MDVRPPRDEELQGVEVAPPGSQYCRGASVSFLGIDTCLSIEQQSGDRSVPMVRGPHQGRPLTVIPRVDRHALVQQSPHALDGAQPGCVAQLLPESRDTRPASVHLRQDQSSNWLSHHPCTPPWLGLCALWRGGGMRGLGASCFFGCCLNLKVSLTHAP